VKVVFLEDVPGTARIGEIKEVKAGFARNYLLPRRLAAPATAAIVKSAEQRAVKEARLQEQRDADARALAEKVEGAAFTITAKAGPSGKLFGSVGAADIAERVGETLGGEFDRHNVVLSESIKDLGDYPVVVKLSKNVTATVAVSVIGEDGTTAADIRARAEAAEGAAPAKPSRDTEAAAAAETQTTAAEDDAGKADEEA
jgi:large subunit ribosomal protein L9